MYCCVWQQFSPWPSLVGAVGSCCLSRVFWLPALHAALCVPLRHCPRVVFGTADADSSDGALQWLFRHTPGPSLVQMNPQSHKERTNSLIISSPTPVSSSKLLYWELRHRGKPFPVFLMPVKLVQHYLQKFFYLEKWLHKNVMEGFHDYFLSVIIMTNLQICQVERYLSVFRWQLCKPSLEFKKQAGASLALVSPAAETPHSDHNQHFWWQRTSQNTPEPSYWAQLNLQS